MSRLALIRDSFADTFRNPRLWLLHFFANAILFALATGWLLIPVANFFHLIFNAVLAVVLLIAVLILHGGTLAYLSDGQSGSSSNLMPALRRAGQHIFAIALCVVAFYLLWLLVDKCETYSATFPTYLRSTFPVSLRRHITQPALDSLFAAFIFVARWVLAPGLILPLLLQSASNGLRAFSLSGLATWRKALTSMTYWVLLTVAAIVGVVVTEKSMSLTPDFKTSTLHGEAFSFAVRLFFAYLLAICAWLLACSVVARRTDAVQSTNLTRNSAA